MQWVYRTMDAEGASVNADCVAAMAAKYGRPAGNRSEGWRCMFGAAVAPYVQTPVIVVNSKYDTWQGKQIIGAGACDGKVATCQNPVKDFWASVSQSDSRSPVLTAPFRWRTRARWLQSSTHFPHGTEPSCSALPPLLPAPWPL